MGREISEMGEGSYSLLHGRAVQHEVGCERSAARAKGMPPGRVLARGL